MSGIGSPVKFQVELTNPFAQLIRVLLGYKVKVLPRRGVFNFGKTVYINQPLQELQHMLTSVMKTKR